MSRLRERFNSVAQVVERHRPAAQAKIGAIDRRLTSRAMAAHSVTTVAVSDPLAVAESVEEGAGDGAEAGEQLSPSTAAGEDVLGVLAPDKAPPALKPDVAHMEREKARNKIRGAIAKLNGRDKLGVSAEVLGAAGGAAGGAAAAGAIAGAVGATTLLGSPGLAAVLGGVFVTTTPIGWVVGTAVLAGAAGYGLARLARSGGTQDRVRQELIARLKKRLQDIDVSSQARESNEKLSQLVAVLLDKNVISSEQGRRMIDLVEKGTLSTDLAVARLSELARAAGVTVAERPK